MVKWTGLIRRELYSSPTLAKRHSATVANILCVASCSVAASGAAFLSPSLLVPPRAKKRRECLKATSFSRCSWNVTRSVVSNKGFVFGRDTCAGVQFGWIKNSYRSFGINLKTLLWQFIVFRMFQRKRGNISNICARSEFVFVRGTSTRLYTICWIKMVNRPFEFMWRLSFCDL